MKLYEINNAIESILDGYEVIDLETGEIMGFDSLEQLQMDRAEKLESVACYIKSLRADSIAYKAEMDALNSRRKAADAKADRLTEFLKEQLAGEKLKTARVSISYATSQSVKIVECACIPMEYMRVIPEQYEPDKIALKQALKSGVEFDGITLETKKNIIIK